MHGSVVLVSNWVDELVVTKGAAGADILKENEQVSVPAMPCGEVVDTGCG